MIEYLFHLAKWKWCTMMIMNLGPLKGIVDLSNYKTCTFNTSSVNLASKLILTVVAGVCIGTGGVAANRNEVVCQWNSFMSARFTHSLAVSLRIIFMASKGRTQTEISGKITDENVRTKEIGNNWKMEIVTWWEVS